MLKICLVGYKGYWAKNLERAFKNTSGIQITAYVDQAGEYKSLPEIQDNLYDAAVIATPPDTHFKIAAEAILRGKHVLIEKPMTIHKTHAHALNTAASKNNVKIAVDHTFLFSDHIRTIKKVIESGKIGKPLRIKTSRMNLGKFQDSGVVWDLAPHDIALANYLFGKPTIKHVQLLKHIDPKVADTALIDMAYGDVSYSLNLSWLYPKKVRNTVILGTEGMIDYDMMAERPLKIYDKRAKKGETFWEHSFDWVKVFEGETREPLVVLAEEFRDYILDGKEFISKGDLGQEVVECIQQIIAAE